MSNSLQGALIATLTLVACGRPADPPPEPLTHTQMLNKLGLDTDLPAEPVGPDGARLPDGYHPLRKKFSALDPRAEIYWAGWSNGSHTEGLLDDGFTAAPFAPLLTPTDETWTRNAEKAALAADVDGDGVQEIVVVYYVPANPPALPVSELRIKVVDGKNGAVIDSAPITFATGVAPLNGPPGRFSHAVAASDVDGDGKDEIIVGYRDVFILDDAEHHFAVLDRKTYGSDRISVAAGDFDAAPGDLTGEFAVLFSFGGISFVDTFDGLTSTSHREVLFSLNDSARTVFEMTEGVMTAGNFDHDNADELAFYGNRANGNVWCVVLMDDANHGYSWFRGFQGFPLAGLDTGRVGPVATLEALDLDGDRVDELFADLRIYDGLETIDSSSSFATVSDLGKPAQVNIIDAHFGTFLNGGLPPWIDVRRAAAVAHGNVTGAGETAQRSGTEELIAVNPTNNQLVMGLIDGAGSFSWQPVPGSNGNGAPSYADVLVAANVDRDSAIVRYDGEHQLQFTDPQVLALLSAAPYYDAASGVMQQTGNSYTSFGTGMNTATNTEQSLGVTVGVSFGYEANFLNLAKSKWDVTLELAFDETSSKGRERYDSITYATGVEDSAVFTAVPFDVYHYTVVSAPEGSEADVGTRVSINMPRKPLTLLTTAKFFDENNGDNPDVSAMFHHTAGNPRSYPTKSDADAACGMARCFRSELHTVGEGTGFTEVQISDANSSSVKYAFDVAQTFSYETSAGGWTFGASLRFHEGWAMQTTTTKYSIFTGRVGHISGLTPDRLYSFGLLARPVGYAGGGNETMLIDYWVE